MPECSPENQRAENRLAEMDRNPYSDRVASLACIYPELTEGGTPLRQQFAGGACSSDPESPQRLSEILDPFQADTAMQEVLGLEFRKTCAVLKDCECQSFLQAISLWERECFPLST